MRCCRDMTVRMRTKDLYQRQYSMRCQRNEQDYCQHRGYRAVGVERGGEQAQRRRTGQYRLRKQRWQQQGALPEIAPLGLTEKKGGIACRARAEKDGGNEQPV